MRRLMTAMALVGLVLGSSSAQASERDAKRACARIQIYNEEIPESGKLDSVARAEVGRAIRLLKKSGVSGAKVQAMHLSKATNMNRVVRLARVLSWCVLNDFAAAPTATTTATTTPLTMPSGDPVFPGYPKLVPLASIDFRVRNWFEIGGPPSDQVVEVAPGVFAPYNPVVPDLDSYLDGPVDGDCAVRNTYFPTAGGACWSGVAAV